MPSWLHPISPVLIIGVCVCTVIALIWTLWWIPIHHYGGRIATRIIQALSTLGTIFLVMMLIFLGLNHENQWFTTWGSVLGITGKNSETQTAGGELSTDQPPVGWLTATPTELQSDPMKNPAFAQQGLMSDAPTGQYVSVTIPGPLSGQNQPATIWLPPSYLEQPDRFYPVIMGFSGIPGSPDTIVHNFDPGSVINTLINKGIMREAIVVLPTIFPNNVDTECVDASDGSTMMETYLYRDVVDWAKKNLRADPDKNGWASFGYSAGGFCSTMLTMRHPDIFTSSISLSGLFTASFEGRNLLAKDETKYDLAKIAVSNPPEADLWFMTAKDDPASYQSWQKFNPMVTAPTTLTARLFDTGGHSFSLWRKEVQEGFEWLAQTHPHFSKTE